MDTIVARINLSTVSTVRNLDTEIQNLCAKFAGDDYHLASTFTYQNHLVLIFQNLNSQPIIPPDDAQ